MQSTIAIYNETDAHKHSRHKFLRTLRIEEKESISAAGQFNEMPCPLRHRNMESLQY